MYYDSKYILDKLNSKRKEENRIEAESDLVDFLACQMNNAGDAIACTSIAKDEINT